MKYIRNTLEFNIKEPSSIALGKFDGLHQGHRYLLDQVKKARGLGMAAVAFTFDISPRTLSEDNVKVLLTNREKEQAFDDFGLDYVVECPFTEKLRMMEPCDFLKMLMAQINVKQIVAGRDFRFGRDRKGGYEDLVRHTHELGYKTVIVDKVRDGGTYISSSRIRGLIADGDMEEASRLLGYPYFFTANVTHGTRLGSSMGIPTVNQIPSPDKLLPPNGVYASRVILDGKTYPAVTDVGTKPTVAGSRPVAVETHILDYTGDLYDKELRVSFLKYLRPEKKFSSIDDLWVEISSDIKQAHAFFSTHM
ncbi:MAG: bifunctional riboflavin kinase/FAD synthetase [Clostridiales bacterium]|nr:bifunctional riboflavin kinase/FAD synthetase [Clostridiales bacterium]